MRILVTGSRDWPDRDAIWTALDALAEAARSVGEPVSVVHGCARGADTFADQWARARQLEGWPIHIDRHPADWGKHGRRAGHVRNAKMVRLGADVCLAFIKGGSSGATACAELAEDHSIRTERFVYLTADGGYSDSPPEATA